MVTPTFGTLSAACYSVFQKSDLHQGTASAVPRRSHSKWGFSPGGCVGRGWSPDLPITFWVGTTEVVSRYTANPLLKQAF